MEVGAGLWLKAKQIGSKAGVKVIIRTGVLVVLIGGANVGMEYHI
jgi:hypothetical protein